MLRLRSFSVDMMTATEASAMIGAKKLGFISWKNVVFAPMEPRLKIQAVAVVPILAPMMRPTVCAKGKRPALTSPTTMMVVADEDWIMAVTPAPKRTPFTGLDVIFSSMPRNFDPETSIKLLLISCMPNKNRARPPNSVTKLNISILFLKFR